MTIFFAGVPLQRQQLLVAGPLLAAAGRAAGGVKVADVPSFRSFDDEMQPACSYSQQVCRTHSGRVSCHLVV